MDVFESYIQIIPACWKADKNGTVNHIPEVKGRKLWAGEKVHIPAGSAKLVKVRIENGWRGEGFVESLQPEEQDAGKRLVLPESAYNLEGEVQAVYVENHAEEEVELCIGQRVGTVHSLYIDKEVWLKEELSGRDEPEVRGGSINNLFESKYKTEEDKKKFIRESFKIDENEILNKDEKLKEEMSRGQVVDTTQGPNEKRALSYLDGFLSFPFINDTEKELIKAAKQAVKIAKFQKLQDYRLIRNKNVI